MLRAMICLFAMIGALPCSAQDREGEKKDSDRPADRIEKPQVQMATRALSFQMNADGAIELTVTEQREGKQERRTYEAKSFEEFKQKYPEVAERYQIDRLTSPRFAMPPAGPGWDDWKRSFAHDWFWDAPGTVRTLEPGWRRFHSPEFDRWRDDQQQLFERFRALPRPTEESPSAADSSRLGVVIGPVGEALAQHLNLNPQEGVVVLDVENGSRAEKAGLQRYDIIQKLNGQSVAGAAQFQQSIRERSKDEECKLEIIRRGRSEQVMVEPISTAGK